MTVKSDVPNPLVHKVTLNPGNEVRKAKTKMDEVLEEKEARAAIRYSAAEMERMAIEAENETARLRGEPPKYKHHGGEGMDEEERQKQEEQRERMMNSAKALIDSGLDPRQVGQMLLGLTPTPATSGYPPAQGMGFEDVMKIVTLVVGKKETDKLEGIIASLDKKVDELAKGGGRGEGTRPIDPITFAKQQAEAVAAWHKAINEIIPKSPHVTQGGESLEVVKERNRHDEKMEEVKAEAGYKKTLGETLSDLPERIGRGIAGQITEEEDGGDGGNSDGKLPYIICSEEGCGTKIYTPPGAKQLTCPKCGSIYQGEEAPETK